MSAKLIKRAFMFEEWEFDSKDDAKLAAEKAAVVCGDSVREKDGRYEIYNFHQDGVRWIGNYRAV